MKSTLPEGRSIWLYATGDEMAEVVSRCLLQSNLFQVATQWLEVDLNLNPLVTRHITYRYTTTSHFHITREFCLKGCMASWWTANGQTQQDSNLDIAAKDTALPLGHHNQNDSKSLYNKFMITLSRDNFIPRRVPMTVTTTTTTKVIIITERYLIDCWELQMSG